MKCIALATRFNQENITWHIPNSSYSISAFFTKRSLQHLEDDLRTQINELCNLLQFGEHIRFEENKHFIHIQKLENDCCAVICDTELTNTQMGYLSLYLLSKRVSLSTIANNLDYYTKDFKTQKLHAELEEVLNIMQHNLNQALERGSKLDKLVEQVNALEENSRQFELTVKKVTSSSCWPSRCTIL